MTGNPGRIAETLADTCGDLRLVAAAELLAIGGTHQVIGQLGLDVNVNLIASSEVPGRAGSYLANMVGAFNQFSSPQYGNALKRVSEPKSRIVSDFILRIFHDKRTISRTNGQIYAAWGLADTATDEKVARTRAAIILHTGRLIRWDEDGIAYIINERGQWVAWEALA